MEQISATMETEQKLPKNTKANRYYYKNREAILEKKRLARLAKNGVDITSESSAPQLSLEERRKMKMEFLGVLKTEQ
jgi:hypothetical protein